MTLLRNALPNGKISKSFLKESSVTFFGIHSIGIAVSAPESFKEVVIIQNSGRTMKKESTIITT